MPADYACVDESSFLPDNGGVQLRPRSCAFRFVGTAPDGRLLPAFDVTYTAPATGNATGSGGRASLLQRTLYPLMGQSNSVAVQDVRATADDAAGGSGGGGGGGGGNGTSAGGGEPNVIILFPLLEDQ